MLAMLLRVCVAAQYAATQLPAKLASFLLTPTGEASCEEHKTMSISRASAT